jgi:hypothetical protein
MPQCARQRKKFWMLGVQSNDSTGQGINQAFGLLMTRIFVAVPLLTLMLLSVFASIKQETAQKVASNPLERQVPFCNVELLFLASSI